jgi:hypothetical protein
MNPVINILVHGFSKVTLATSLALEIIMAMPLVLYWGWKQHIDKFLERLDK